MGPLAWRRLLTTLCSLTALPAADFTTYIGDASDYHVARVIADSAGNTYVAGSRLPYAGIFVMKLDTGGKAVLFATLSGKGMDRANDLAVDAAGNLYVAGATTSPLLPLRNALQTSPGPGFLVKWNPDATQILFSTYFPAPIAALAIDTSGNLYCTGTTNAPAFPVTPGLPAGTVTPPTTIASASGAFLTKIAASGDRILYSALIAGHQKNCGAGSSCFLSSRYTAGAAVAVDSAGNAYLAGNTDTDDLPVTPGALLTSGVGAFVAKVNAAGNALGYLTYLGPGYMAVSPNTNPANVVTGIAADAAGNAYVTGSTSDAQFPITGSTWQRTLAGGGDAFAAKINPQGTAVVWGTYLGGKASDTARGIALDPAGNIWINGTTGSPDFPNRQGWSQGSDFLVALDSAGAQLPYSSRFPDETASASLAIDAAGTLHFAGPAGLVSTLSPALALAPRVFGIANAAHGPAGGRIAPGEVISIYGPHIGPAAPLTATADGSGFLPKLLGGVQVLINGSALTLLYVSDSQINAVAPRFFSGPPRLRVTGNGLDTGEFAAALIEADPQIFQRLDGSAAAVNQDGTINSPEHPARSGSVVAIWITGAVAGASFSKVSEGQIAPAAQDLACCQGSAAGPLRVLYGGDAPGMIGGVMQVNFQVPDLTSSYGETLAFTISSHDRTSGGVRIYVAP